MVCTGSKSEELAKKAVKTVVQQLRKGGIKVKKDAVVSIQNIVSSINLGGKVNFCLLYTSPSPRDRQKSRMPSSA